MGRSHETYSKKEIRKQKDKKRKEKEKRRLAKKENEKKDSFDDMIAYVDENGNPSSAPPDPDKKIKIKADQIEISVPKKEAIDEAEKERTGKVTHFNNSKGFGFIKDLESQRDYFVHINDMIDDIEEGDSVHFEIGMGHKGAVALKVKKSK